MCLKSVLNNQFQVPNLNSFYSYRDNKDLIQRLCLYSKLDAHSGCVNAICWGNQNNIILSGSDDQKLSISDPFTGSNIASIQTGHRSNIFSAKFLPKHDEKIISCAAGGDIYLTDLNASATTNSHNKFLCHGEKSCYELRTFNQDPFTFVSCGQDGTCKLFDIRQNTKCDKLFCQEHTLIKLSAGITAIAVNPFIGYHLACATLDGILRIYDIRCLSVGSVDTGSQKSFLSQLSNGLFACFGMTNSTEDEAANTKSNIFNSSSNKRVTSVQYDNYGNHLLVSYQPNSIYLLDWRDLSDENKNDFIREMNSSNEQNSINSAENDTAQASTERKFRIQTDWSDTGPNSLPFNEMNNNETNRLAKRLNDWFMNMYTSTSSRNTTTRSTLNATNESNEPLPVSATNSEEARRKNKNDRGEDVDTNSNEDESDANEEENEKSKKSQTESRPSNSMNFRQANLFTITSSIIGSRIRGKQAAKNEINLVKAKPSPKIKMIYTGHRNTRTMIKECNFWGNDYIISGSDCGHIFFWNKHNGNIVNLLEADKHVVNCIQENPNYPVLASSGIDYDIKIWQPTLEGPLDINSKIDMVTKRNKLMLNDTRNTILIPVQFMVPALRLFGADFGARNLTRANGNNNNSSNNNNNNT